MLVELRVNIQLTGSGDVGYFYVDGFYGLREWCRYSHVFTLCGLSVLVYLDRFWLLAHRAVILRATNPLDN